MINPLLDPFAWFLNLLYVLPAPFFAFIVLSAIVAGFIFFLDFWRNA